MALNETQLKAIHMLVHENKKKHEIATELGVHRTAWGRWFKNPEFKDEYDRVMHEYMSEISSTAINRVNELMFAESESVSLQAAKDILSRAGYDAVQKSEVRSTTLVVGILDEEEEEEQENTDQLQLDL